MPDLALKTAVASYGHTRPLKNGSTVSEKVALEHVEISPTVSIFRRMIRGLEFDVAEMALSTYLCARSFGKPITAIPVFLLRGFHHGAILYNTGSGISSPSDLEGRRVGVRGYTVTTGVWVRGILQESYGVDLDKVTWVLSGDEHVEEYEAPSNVVPAPEDTDLATMLVSGHIDAAIGAGNVDSSDVQPLIPNARDVAEQHFGQTGIYPINHTLVVKDELLDAHPWLAEELFSVFKTAKKSYLQHLESGDDLDEQDAAMLRMGETVVGDPLPYGLVENLRTLERFVRYLVQQKVIPKSVSVEEIFPESTLKL